MEGAISIGLPCLFVGHSWCNAPETDKRTHFGVKYSYQTVQGVSVIHRNKYYVNI